MAYLCRFALSLLLVFQISSCGKATIKNSSGDRQPSEVDVNLVEVKKPQASETVLTPDSPSEFKKIVDEGQVTFVYLWASWCGECLKYSGIADRVIKASSKESELKNYAVVEADFDKVINDFEIEDEAEVVKASKIKDELGIIGTPKMFFLINGTPVKYFDTTNEANKIVEEFLSISKADQNQIEAWHKEFQLKAEQRNEEAGDY